MKNTALCPSCGTKLALDEELCKSCGKLMSLSAPPRQVMRLGALARFSPWLKVKFIRNIDHDKLFKEDPVIDPEFSFLSGNLYNDDEK